MTVTDQPTSLTFDAPDGGSWMLDTTHHGRRPISRFMQSTYRDEFPTAMGSLFERFGLPLAEFRVALINGCFYVRPMGIGEPENPKGEPPLALMKLIARLHPTLRRRNKIARQAWQERRWREDVDSWFGGGRDTTIARHLTFQDVDITALDDAGLADHLVELGEHFVEQVRLSGSTHGGDIIPVGDFMAHCQRWGIDPGAAAGLLAGASPASIETAHMLQPVGAALAAEPVPPTTIAELRQLGDDVGKAIDDWLRHHGHRLVTSDDVDGETLIERPDLQLKALLAADASPVEPAPADAGEIRALVPPDDRALFDELLAEARYGLRLRDDNVGVRWNWTAGLVRRALLEAGRRLVATDRLDNRDHVIELEPAEVQALLRGHAGPSKETVADRWRFRQLVLESEPPIALGPAGGEPPIEAFPAPLARATAAVLAMIHTMNGEPASEPLSGVGVGDTVHSGRAVVVSDAIEALERVEPGDVVIAPFTGPSWNSLLPAVGALVVEEGGAMSHAAIVAREFGIPTVVGVTDACALIADGSRVTVDPAAGRIRLDA